MPRVKYTKSDLWVKDCLERLFWIEIAKRKTRLQQGEAFSQLLSLRKDLQVYFDSFSSELDDPCEGGEDVVFHIVQFGWEMLDRVNNPKHAHLIKQAAKLFGKRIAAISSNIDYLQGFWLADFLVETDLAHLHGWWSYVISNQGRRELGASGQYSTRGESRTVVATEDLKFEGEAEPVIRIGESISTITSLDFPFRVPRRVPKRRIYAYSTDEHEIFIDGHQLNDKLVLELDLLGPLPPMKKIGALIKSRQRLAKAQRELELLERGEFASDESKDCEEGEDSDFLDLLVDPPENHQFMLASTSVRPMIAGLFCWDLVAQQMTEAQAAAKVSMDLLGNNDASVFTSAKVIRAFKDVVRPRVEKYEPAQLPWNS